MITSSESPAPEPWHSFLQELDDGIDEAALLVCIGGFVVTQLYGLERSTLEVDVIELAPRTASDKLMRHGAGYGPLHRNILYAWNSDGK